MSLVTGKMRTIGIEGKSPDHSVSQNLTIRDNYVVSTGSASDYLMSRTWKGLEPMLGQTPVTSASQGQSGIAWGYEGEGNKDTARGKPDGQE